MDNKSRFWYVLFVLVGFAITLALIQYFTRSKEERVVIEKFETTTVPVEPVNVVQDLPRKTRLVQYLTAFSEPSTYQCDTNYWCDAVNPKTKFFLLSDPALPTTLKPSEGLPLSGVKLRGPSAYSLSPTAPHTLGSFTLAFYAKIKSLAALDKDEEIVLWDLPAESPHHVQLSIRPITDRTQTPVVVNATEAKITCTFGHSDCTVPNTTAEWVVPRDTLVTNGANPTLFALVFDKDNKVLKFYVGIGSSSNPKEFTFVGDAPDIKLGISEMSINTKKNWDANMVAMAFYNAVISIDDLTTMDTYFSQRSSGYTQMMLAKETLETEIQQLMSKLNTGEDTIRELLEKLNAADKSCSTAASTSDLATKLRRWQITMQGNADITGQDLGKCSILNIKSFGEKAAELEPEEKSAPSSKQPHKYHIPYPSEVSSSTPSSGIDASVTNPTKPASTSTAAKSPTITSSPSSPSSPVDQNDPNGFWKSFFDFLKNQQGKTAETQQKADLNSAYDQLRQEVNTDRTQLGSGAQLQASVQDPAKPVETSIVEGSESQSGFWQTVKGIFADL